MVLQVIRVKKSQVVNKVKIGSVPASRAQDFFIPSLRTGNAITKRPSFSLPPQDGIFARFTSSAHLDHRINGEKPLAPLPGKWEKIGALNRNKLEKLN